MAYLPNEVGLDLLPTYEREYKELCDNWASLERKAQLTGGAAGALLAGVVAFLGNPRFQVPRMFYVFFAAIGIALFIAGLYALAALWVSDETLPPPGEKLRDLAWELKHDTPEHWVADYRREVTHKRVVFWDQACKDLHKSNQRKGRYVRNAQGWLVGAAGVAMLFVATFTAAMLCGSPQMSNRADR
jgi:hypothetical protein